MQAYNKAVKGERLTPDQRAQFLASGRVQYEAGAKPAIEQLIAQYTRLAEKNEFDPRDVTGGFYGPDTGGQSPDEPKKWDAEMAGGIKISVMR